jgi:hypothetical protein
VDAGYAINVDVNAQQGFSSDYNLFYLTGTEGNAGLWAGTPRTALADWQAANGQDTHSLTGNPLFIDIDGADNVFGGPPVAEGSGEDDNFSLRAHSFAIDAGNAYVAPLYDMLGRGRHDDPSVANTGVGESGLNYYDIGALEFQGDSSDTNPPHITGFLNIPPNGGGTNSVFSSITLSFSEPLDVISARSRANYKLIGSGPDDIFDTSDDVLYSLNPVYSFTETDVVLELVNGALPDGHYRLTVSGTRAIYDTAGNPLDGNGDGSGGDDYVHMFTIDRAPNVAPVATDQVLALAEDGTLLITLAGSDDDNNPLTYSLVSGPLHGTLSAIDPVTHEVTYTPFSNYHGTDSFTFRVMDIHWASDDGVVDLAVTPVNDAPVATAQSVTVNEDQVLTGFVSGTDVDGDALTYVKVGTVPLNGTVSLSSDGAFTYTPNPDFFGTDSIRFRAYDGTAYSANGTVSISVLRVNDAPSFVAGTDQTVAEDFAAQSVAGWATAISAGPANEASQVLSFVVTNDHAGLFSAQPAISPDGTLTYTPALNANGLANLTVVLKDNGGTARGGVNASAPQNFVITLTPVNDAPILTPVGDRLVEEGTALAFTVTASDPDSDVLTFSLDSAPEGAAIDPVTGVFTWAPTDGPLTVDVTVRVTDDDVSPLFDPETFIITVGNVAPILTISGEDKAYTGIPYELSLSSNDPGDDTIQGWTIAWGDGTVTEVDGDPSSVEHIYTAPLPFPADFDGDGDIDGIDALRFVLQYRQGNVGGLGDFDRDGDVDGADLQVFTPKFGRIGWDAYQVSATATDEDGTYASNEMSVVDPPLVNSVHAGSSDIAQDRGCVERVSKLELPAVILPTYSESLGSAPALVYPSSTAPEATGVYPPDLGRLPVLRSGAAADGGTKYEQPNFFHDPAFGRVLGEWQARTSVLGEEFKRFEYKPWNPSSSWSLVDLSADYDDGGLFDLRKAKKTKKTKGELSARWVEAFVSDLRSLEGSQSPNDKIRIVLPEEVEPGEE